MGLHQHWRKKGLINTTTDNDYYKFVITTGGTATFTLSTLPGDYDLRIYSSNGTSQLAVSQNGGTASETISRTYNAGTYYARVYGYNGANSSTVCYTLRVVTGTASRTAESPFVFGDKVSVTPNPAGFSASLIFAAKTTGTAKVIVTNQMGSVVLRSIQPVQEGQNIRKLDVRRLANGLYYVKLQNGAEVQMTKLVINK